MNKMKYKPLNMFFKQTDELKKLIAENPDLPICVVVSSDVVYEDWGSWYAPKLSFELGEILDCEQDINDEKVYTDRDDFEEDVQYILACGDELTDEEYEKKVAEIMAKYEPFWKDVIVIYGNV